MCSRDWSSDVCSSDLVYAPGDATCQTPLTPAPTSATVNGAGNYDSGNFTTAAVGSYRWIAHYSGDAKNNAVDTACNDANESSTVSPASPAISTVASGPVTVGAKIHDVATWSGAGGATGGVPFRVYAPGDTSCESSLGTLNAASNTADSNGNGTYTSEDFTTTAAGVYRWRAFFAGD